MRTLVVLCSLLALYGCNGAATLKQDYHRTEIEQYHKTSATYIPVRVSIYEFYTPVTPELKELVQQSGAKGSLRPVSPSLEDELSDLVAKGEVTLLQDISGVTTNNKALPFSVLNLKKKENVGDELSLVITPALSADAALMQMTVELSQTTNVKKNEYSHYSVNFRQLLKLKGGQKLCIAVPVNDKTNRLIIITQKI
ncbi:MAG: hypothetical protein RSA84_11155 [Acinetobacter sp.]|uniref:hypothetical protein n=1 Tax=Citrobacter freundii TaxID=546 RepID=UPI00214D9342|nr:hypothetical protein [Citrobacter freundii]MCR3712265.1 hypothetical protein [Citrobacter freundii]